MQRTLLFTMLTSALFFSGSLCGCTTKPTPVPRSDPSAPQLGRQDGIVEDVHFPNGDSLLAGSLFRPDGPGPHPAVVLVLGSGARDRAYGGAGTALGQHFARHGFACLAWDKPGVGKSTGDFNTQTFRDRAEETLAAVRFLRERADIRHDRIGLWGHSQGGMVAPLSASLFEDVAFVIEVSGWQGPAWQQDLVRVEAELRADGFPEADVKAATDFARMRMDLIRGTGPFEDLDKEHESVKTLAWFEYVHRCDRALFYGARRSIEYDTGPSWEKVRCPVLVIYGGKDTLSGPPDGLVSIIRRGLEKAGNQDVTVRIFASADHSICTTETGGRKEAGERAKKRKSEDGPDFVPGYLDTMTAWLAERFGPEP
jgi:pimeloyl-ACP methyl ester carboxylesterase